MNPLGRALAWTQSQSLVPLIFVGAIRSAGLSRFVRDGHLAALFPSPATAIARQADVLVVVGRMTHKLAPELLRTYGKMSPPCFVLHVCSAHSDSTPSYGAVRDVGEILPIDVVLKGDPPGANDTKSALIALRERVKAQGRGGASL